MRAALRRLPCDRLLPAGVAVTVFVFACGSSSVHDAVRVGRPLRWVFLVALLALAAACVAAVDRVVVPPLVAAVAAMFLVALAIVSAAWSVEPRLSFERGVSFGLLVATAALLAAARREREVLNGIVTGGVAVALAGLVVLALDHGAAVSPASYEVPARYQGFGENPNTAPLLFALATPIALAFVVGARGVRERVVAAACVAFFAASIVASGSRGGLVAAAVGSVAVALLGIPRMRLRIAAAGAVIALALIGAYVESIPKPTPLTPPPTASAVAQNRKHPATPKPPRYLDADGYYPLEADIGGPLPGGGQPTIRRRFLASSGRVDAWIGAIHQAAQRPLLGFGFGTEARVFVDRYYYFVGGLPENGYIGLALQLGLAGLVAFVVLVIALASAGLRQVARSRPLVAAGAGAVAAGLVVAVVQSYFYSAGDVASLTFWTSAFLLPAAGARA